MDNQNIACHPESKIYNKRAFVKDQISIRATNLKRFSKRKRKTNHGRWEAERRPSKSITADCKIRFHVSKGIWDLYAKLVAQVYEAYVIPTTTLKSSSNDLMMYFWKSNLLPGAKWTFK